MTTSAWKSGTSGVWNGPANWTGPIPNSADADVTIDAPTASSYLVTLEAGAGDLVNSVSLNSSVNLLGVLQTPYNGAELEIDGVLAFATGSPGAISGSLQSALFVNGGTIVNAGTVDAFVQVDGVGTFTGNNGIYFTNYLQSLGVATVDTATIGEYNNATKTLFDGIFEAKGTGSVVNLGGSLGGNIVNIATITGPKPVLTHDFWTQLILNGPATTINEWNGTAYVPVESTLTTIGESGILTVTGQRSYTTTNAITVQRDGTLSETSGTLTTGGLTIDNGGTLTNGVTGEGPNTVTASTDPGVLSVAATVVNNGMIEVEGGGGVSLRGAVTGTGTILFGPSGGVLDVAGAVGPGQTIAMSSGDALIIDNPAAFQATLSPTGAGNTLILGGIVADGVVASGGVISFTSGGVVVDTIATAGAVSGVSVAASGGNTVVSITGPSATIASASAISESLGLPSSPTAFLQDSSSSVVSSDTTGGDLISALPTAAPAPALSDVIGAASSSTSFDASASVAVGALDQSTTGLNVLIPNIQG